MDALTDSGADNWALAEVIMKIKDSGDKEGEVDALLNSKLDDGQKDLIFRNMVSDSKTTAEKIKKFYEAGYSFDDFLRAYDKYEDYVIGGLEPEDAAELYEEMSGIVPEEDRNTPTNLQKWRASVGFSDDVEDQLTALSMVMTESKLASVELAYEYGISPRGFVELEELLPQYDANRNGSYTNAEIKAAIDALPRSWSTTQKAVLWQLMSTSKSAKNNPYDTSVGQKVLDAKGK